MACGESFLICGSSSFDPDSVVPFVVEGGAVGFPVGRGRLGLGRVVEGVIFTGLAVW